MGIKRLSNIKLKKDKAIIDKLKELEDRIKKLEKDK